MIKIAPETRLVDAAFRLLARKSWQELTLAETAKAAKIPLAELFSVAPSKPLLLALMLRRVGQETALRYRPDKESSAARERIFDVALTWFECLAARKAAMRALYEGLTRDPLTLVGVRSEILAAAEWLLTLAEADTGSAVQLKGAALGAVLARAIPVWLEDGKDMTKTMARLDGDLRRGAKLFGSDRSRGTDKT